MTPILLVSLALPLAAEGREVIEIDPEVVVGATVRYFGWDLKGWRDIANTPAKAQKLYGDTKANLVRIPLFALAHRSDGTVDRQRYEAVLTDLRNIRQVRPEVKIFASLKLDGKDTFPDWVESTEDGKIFGQTVKKPDATAYARLVADYVGYFRDEGFGFDFLGLGNETNGALTADRYVQTARLLRDELERRGYEERFRSFLLVAPDAFGVGGARKFVEELAAADALDTVDIFGSHFYPSAPSGNLDEWRKLGSVAKRPLWHTELHMGHSEDDTNARHLRDALTILFTTAKLGVEGYVWWGRGINDRGVDDLIKRAALDTMVGAHAVQTSGSYWAKGNPPDQPIHQAFRAGDRVTLWVCNPGPERKEVLVKLASGRADDLTSTRWSGPNTLTAEGLGQLDVTPSDDGHSLTLRRVPRASVAMVSFALTEAPAN